MSRCNPVQKKISCLFETVIISEKSTKRTHQPFKVVASDTVKELALQADISNSFASEKLDGTCVYATEFQGQPWLWARLDRKPNKPAEKKFKKYQSVIRDWQLAGKPEGSCPGQFQWDTGKDFKDVPAEWVPALGVEHVDGVPQPDNGGHIPGWVPIELKSRQYCWHLQPVHLEAGLAIVLRPSVEKDMKLEIVVQKLSDLNESTLELIGTNINGNPYKIGSKPQPIHLLSQHGSIGFTNPPPYDYNQLQKWFNDEPDGKVEGIVWHCENRQLFKLHRHHLELPWPIDDLKLLSSQVLVNVNLDNYPDIDFCEKPLFQTFGKLNGTIFDSLCEVTYNM